MELKICATPGCSNRFQPDHTRRRHSYCPIHERRETHRRAEKPIKALYSSAEWQHARALALLRDDHRCQQCRRPANTVHHITPLSEAGDPVALDNLATLCETCHGRIDAARTYSGNAKTYHPHTIAIVKRNGINRAQKLEQRVVNHIRYTKRRRAQEQRAITRLANAVATAARLTLRDQRDTQVKAMRTNGMGYKTIAHALGVDHTTARAIIKRIEHDGGSSLQDARRLDPAEGLFPHDQVQGQPA